MVMAKGDDCNGKGNEMLTARFTLFSGGDKDKDKPQLGSACIPENMYCNIYRNSDCKAENGWKDNKQPSTAWYTQITSVSSDNLLKGTFAPGNLAKSIQCFKFGRKKGKRGYFEG
ncbi:hypothetical protein AJ80_02914 [Polytolypa hystricis UAMH7299]|uniref:Uncharacterized protein n=1 Tax=Polytolypa hystricis (strain UAMH7299) TaxID=1447883 RepID=A0A2B7YPM7_POLH7|nr:hypothetical protein AJ80_02914 [Polytolypa hystricis UAMH7299]